MIKEKFKKKYAELSLTGDISQNPKYTYEYDLPTDFDEAISIISYVDDEENKKTIDFDVCLSKKNQLVLTTNECPAVLCYKPIILMEEQC